MPMPKKVIINDLIECGDCFETAFGNFTMFDVEGMLYIDIASLDHECIYSKNRILAFYVGDERENLINRFKWKFLGSCKDGNA